MPTLLDTHAWVWWVTEDRRLSKEASDAIIRAAHTEGVWLSVISIWEVAKKVEKQQLVLDRPLRQWLASARHHRARLVTADRNLRRYPHVQTIW